MTRSLARLSGRCRVASALGAGALTASLALAGCSSSSPKGGGTIPPLNTGGTSSSRRRHRRRRLLRRLV